MSFLNKLPLKPESSEKTEQKSTLLALDIGTSFVKCVLAQPVDKDKPDKALKFKKTLPSGRLKILGFAKAPESPGNIKDGRIADIQGVVASCEKALAKLESQTGERASAVVIGVSGEQIKSKTSTIRYRRDTPNKPITSAELEELLKKIEKRNLEKLKAELSLETDNPEVDLNLINSAVVSISIDGYRINNPVGFRGAEVLIEYYTAFAPSVVVSEEKKKDPFKRNTMFVSIDEELSDTADRPLAPSTATILSEKQVKERFSYTDDQLVYRPDMKLGEKIIVTFRKVAVWFSDVWDKYVLFMKNHFPTIFEGHDVSRITTIGICALFVLIGLIVIGSLLLR